MEGRVRRYGGQVSPERTKVWVEPPPKHYRHHHQHQHQQQHKRQGKKIPVVYYLCRNHHLEHPHFIEVPCSSPEGLYLRDVINRLNLLRGKGMAAMYSWSCKRSYKNGFVWHDLADDDLILPANGNEYILKGSELLDQSPPDRHNHGTGNPPELQNPKQPQQDSPTSVRTQEACSSSSSPAVVTREAKLPPSPPPPLSSPHAHIQEGELSPTTYRAGSSGNVSPEPGGRTAPSSGMGSPNVVEYRVYKPMGAQDASTQTDHGGGRKAPELDTRIIGVSTDDGSMDSECNASQREQIRLSKLRSEIVGDEASPAPTTSSASSGAKTDTLESLIRAEASKMNRYRIPEEDEVFTPMRVKLKATNMLMQLITCGSIPVKDHRRFGIVPTYGPRFTHMKFPTTMLSSSMMVGELDCLPNDPRVVGLGIDEKEYFSGSLIETKKHEKAGRGVPTLKRSPSFEEDRDCKTPDARRDKEKVVDSARSKCLPRTIKIASCKQSRNDAMMSPISDTRNSSAGPDCFKSSPLSSSRGASSRITDASSTKGSSMRLESFKEEKEKVIKIEERLTSGARVIIQSRSLYDDSEDSSGSL